MGSVEVISIANLNARQIIEGTRYHLSQALEALPESCRDQRNSDYFPDPRQPEPRNLGRLADEAEVDFRESLAMAGPGRTEDSVLFPAETGEFTPVIEGGPALHVLSQLTLAESLRDEGIKVGRPVIIANALRGLEERDRMLLERYMMYRTGQDLSREDRSALHGSVFHAMRLLARKVGPDFKAHPEVFGVHRPTDSLGAYLLKNVVQQPRLVPPKETSHCGSIKEEAADGRKKHSRKVILPRLERHIPVSVWDKGILRSIGSRAVLLTSAAGDAPTTLQATALQRLSHIEAVGVASYGLDRTLQLLEDINLSTADFQTGNKNFVRPNAFQLAHQARQLQEWAELHSKVVYPSDSVY